MRVALFVLAALIGAAVAHPKLSCASYQCSAGWNPKTNLPATNIACLGGVCTDRVCCNPPTCASLTNPSCVLKSNARSIQCPGQTLAGCTDRVCCARNQATSAPTQTPTQLPTERPTQRPTQQPTERPTNAPTLNPTQAPTNAPTNAPTAAPTQNVCGVNGADGWTVYFCNYLNDVRVRKMVLDFDHASGDVSLRDGSIALVARPGGGDGIIVNPQNHRQLFVGGQTDRIFVVNTTNPNIDTNWWRQFTTGTRVFHVIALDNETIIGSHVDGWSNVSYSKLVGGTLPDRSTASVIPVTGAMSRIVSIIPTLGRTIYTTSTEAGEPGNVGFCTVSNTELRTETPFITNVRAHNGVFQESSQNLYVWGGTVISQYSIDGVLLSSLDIASLIGTVGTPGARHVDNGIIFQDRWLLIVSNAGKLLWFDLQSAPLIANTHRGSFIVTDGDEFDAITVPVCVTA